MTRAQTGELTKRFKTVRARSPADRVAAASLFRRDARIYSLLTVFCAFVGCRNLQPAESSPCEPGFGCFRQQLADGSKVRRRAVTHTAKKEEPHNQRVARLAIFPKPKNIASTLPAS
jgi:hypothetical protein